MDTPNLNTSIKPVLRKKLSRKFWLIAVPTVIVLVIGGWWVLDSQQAQSACVIGEPGKVYATAPAVKHMYAEEKLAYRLRDNGQFVPIDEVKVAKTATHEYSLRVSFDQQYANPRFGSKITGKLELLEDGQPVSEPPKNEKGQLVFTNLSAPVYIYGALVQTQSELNPAKTQSDWWPSTRSIPQNTDFTILPVFDYRLPYPVSYIYAPGGVSQRGVNHFRGWAIDLSKGSAEFEFNYFGLRYAPYLQLAFGASYNEMNVSKTLCFADQVSTKAPKAVDSLAQQTKKEFYYSVSATPGQLANNKLTRVKLEITAKNAKNNKVDTNPFQRVEVSAVSLGQMTDQSIGYGSSRLTEPRLTFQPRGTFVLADSTNPAIEQQMLFQTARNRDNYTNSNEGSTNTVFTDLINGKATIYYDFSGTDDSLNTPLTFVVQPASFELKTMVWDEDKAPLSTASNRSKQNLTLPEKPTQFIGESATRRPNTPDLPTSPEPDFLYQTWQTNAIRELVYAVYPVPVGDPTGGWLGKAFARLAIWQILIVLFGGLMLAWQLRQQKNKNKTNDGQIK